MQCLLLCGVCLSAGSRGGGSIAECAPQFCLSCQGCYVVTNLFLLRIAKEVTILAVPPCKSSKAWQQNVSAVCLLLETWQQNVSAVCLLLETWQQNVSAVCLLDGDVCMMFLLLLFSVNVPLPLGSRKCYSCNSLAVCQGLWVHFHSHSDVADTEKLIG